MQSNTTPLPHLSPEHSSVCVTLDTDHMLFSVPFFFRIDLLLATIDNFECLLYVRSFTEAFTAVAHGFLNAVR